MLRKSHNENEVREACSIKDESFLHHIALFY